jgi:uncharacterized protein YhjY with autotransporter beta-barrel domain
VFEVIAPTTSIGDTAWSTLSIFYSEADIDIQRGYQNGGALEISSGNTDSNVWAVRLRTDWEDIYHAMGVELSPFVDLSFIKAEINGYSERLGSAPATFNASDLSSSEARIGINSLKPITNTIALTFGIEGIYRFYQSDSSISGVLDSSTPFNIEVAGKNDTWARLSIGGVWDLSPFKLLINANASSNGQEPNSWLAANLIASF